MLKLYKIIVNRSKYGVHHHGRVCGSARTVEITLPSGQEWTLTYWSGRPKPFWAEVIPVEGDAGEEVIYVSPQILRKIYYSLWYSKGIWENAPKWVYNLSLRAERRFFPLPRPKVQRVEWDWDPYEEVYIAYANTEVET